MKEISKEYFYQVIEYYIIEMEKNTDKPNFESLRECLMKAYDEIFKDYDNNRLSVIEGRIDRLYELIGKSN